MMIIISISIDILILNLFFLCFEPSFPSGTLDIYSFRNFTISRTTDIAGETGETLASFLLTWLNDVYYR